MLGNFLLTFILGCVNIIYETIVGDFDRRYIMVEYVKMKREEAMALLNFTEERLEKLDPCPKFFGKAKWHERMLQFEYDFLDTLTEGRNNFWGAVYQFFEENDNLFMGTNGMKELADHTFYEEGSWIYRAKGEKVIYTA